MYFQNTLIFVILKIEVLRFAIAVFNLESVM